MLNLLKVPCSGMEGLVPVPCPRLEAVRISVILSDYFWPNEKGAGRTNKGHISTTFMDQERFRNTSRPLHPTKTQRRRTMWDWSSRLTALRSGIVTCYERNWFLRQRQQSIREQSTTISVSSILRPTHQVRTKNIKSASCKAERRSRSGNTTNDNSSESHFTELKFGWISEESSTFPKEGECWNWYRRQHCSHGRPQPKMGSRRTIKMEYKLHSWWYKSSPSWNSLSEAKCSGQSGTMLHMASTLVVERSLSTTQQEQTHWLWPLGQFQQVLRR